jgi:hypothetical protein
VKKSFLILFFFISLIVTGCSYKYTVRDFPSKQEFYNYFNNAVKDKCVEAAFLNDSSYIANNGAEVLNDTLYLLEKSVCKTNRYIPLKEIKEIKYSYVNFKSADIYLNNNRILTAEDVRTVNDSVEYSGIDTLVSRKNFAPVDKVKEISYKNRCTGIIPGLVSGLIFGVIPGTIKSVSSDSGGNHAGNPNPTFFEYCTMGALSGSIIGFIIGNRYNYYFNVLP